MLGLNTIYREILLDALHHTLPVCEESRNIYRHACLVAAVAYEAAALTGQVPPQPAATIGLLHEIGQCVLLLLAQQHPPLTSVLPMIQRAPIGAELLKRWNLPERVWRVVALQDHPAFAPPAVIDPAVQEEVAVLYLARLYAQRAIGETPTPQRMAFVKVYMAVLGMTPVDFEAVATEKVLPALRNKSAGLPADVRNQLAP